MLIDPTSEQLSAHETAALEQVETLFGQVSPDLPIGDGRWTAREVLAHLVTVIERYLDPAVTLANSPREVDKLNQEQLDAMGSASVAELLNALERRATAYSEFWPLLPLEQEFPFHSGLRLDVAALRSNWIGELLVHGRDVAVTAGRPWHVDDDAALLLVRLLVAVMPGYVRTDEIDHAVFVIAPDGGVPATVSVAAGMLTIGPELPGCPQRLSGPAVPVALLLYGRLDLPAAEAAGVRITGDRECIIRVLDALEDP